MLLLLKQKLETNSSTCYLERTCTCVFDWSLKCNLLRFILGKSCITHCVSGSGTLSASTSVCRFQQCMGSDKRWTGKLFSTSVKLNWTVTHCSVTMRKAFYSYFSHMKIVYTKAAFFVSVIKRTFLNNFPWTIDCEIYVGVTWKKC